jgi:hypothetical protein
VVSILHVAAIVSYPTGLGVGAASVAAVSSPPAMAQAVGDEMFRPARHAQVDWYDKINGIHCNVFVSSSAEDVGSALQFASNNFAASRRIT